MYTLNPRYGRRALLSKGSINIRLHINFLWDVRQVEVMNLGIYEVSVVSPYSDADWSTNGGRSGAKLGSTVLEGGT